MFLQMFRSFKPLKISARYSSSRTRNFKVAVLGAAGGIGQSLSLMLKQSGLIQELALYDIVNTRGVAMDISHVNTKCKVDAFIGHNEIFHALKNIKPRIRAVSLDHWRSKSDGFKVTVVGSSGGVGVPLSLLLKQSPLIEELCLYDKENASASAKDIYYIDAKPRITSYDAPSERHKAYSCAKIVVLLAGVPRKPGMTRAQLFDVNANIVKEAAENCAEICPKTCLLVVTNPVNSLVPVACEVFKKAGKDNDNRVFGVTTLDLVRASTFVADEASLDPSEVHVPVIGAHSGVTIVPLFSQTTPHVKFSQEQAKRLTVAVKEAGTEVVKAKGKGSATLSIAFATMRLVLSVARALQGEQCIVECSYVKSDVIKNCDYLSTPLELGQCGIKKNLGLPKMNEFEKQLLEKAIPVIQKDIKKGVDFVNQGDKNLCKKKTEPCGKKKEKSCH